MLRQGREVVALLAAEALRRRSVDARQRSPERPSGWLMGEVEPLEHQRVRFHTNHLWAQLLVDGSQRREPVCFSLKDPWRRVRVRLDKEALSAGCGATERLMNISPTDRLEVYEGTKGSHSMIARHARNIVS